MQKIIRWGQVGVVCLFLVSIIGCSTPSKDARGNSRSDAAKPMFSSDPDSPNHDM